MSNKLTICVSGRRQAGKSSLGKYILSEFLNLKVGYPRFTIEKVGKDVLVIDGFNGDRPLILDYPNEQVDDISNVYSAKIYSFADPLKRICIDLLGLDISQCYGSDNDKNSDTHIVWDSLPLEIREKYRKGKTERLPKNKMSGREIMQILGSDIFRKIDETCWARGTYKQIERDNHALSIIVDARFPNEITLGTENGAKAIRLDRNPNPSEHISETALDNFPLGEYDLFVRNEDMTMKESHLYVKPYIMKWFREAGII